MSYRHGIYIQEQSTQLTALSRQDGGLIVAFGTAPIHTATEPAPVGEPILCNSYTEAVKYFGYSSDTATWTLCEAMEVIFGLYQVAPVVLVNVFDPVATARTVTVDTNKSPTSTALLKTVPKVVDGHVVLKETIKVTDKDGDEFATVNAYMPADGDSYTVNVIDNDLDSSETVHLSYCVENWQGDNTLVSDTAIAALSDAVEKVYPKYGQNVGLVIAPGLSQYTGVAVAMGGGTENIDGRFSAMAIVDTPPLETLKNGGESIVGRVRFFKFACGNVPNQIVCFPRVTLGGKEQWLSTHLAGRMARLAADNGDIPYLSPSNQTALIDGATEYLTWTAANQLNGQGIVTVINNDGWKFWGNRTAAYPSNTDPKDCWISVRRMFDYIKLVLVRGLWGKIDMPITQRHVQNLVNSVNIMMNGLTARGAILGGRVEFVEEDNTTADLMDGKLTFRCYLTPPSPAEEINFTLEYDTSYQSVVFG